MGVQLKTRRSTLSRCVNSARMKSYIDDAMHRGRSTSLTTSVSQRRLKLPTSWANGSQNEPAVLAPTSLLLSPSYKS
jgi:hypothetical protein